MQSDAAACFTGQVAGTDWRLLSTLGLPFFGSPGSGAGSPLTDAMLADKNLHLFSFCWITCAAQLCSIYKGARRACVRGSSVMSRSEDSQMMIDLSTIDDLMIRGILQIIEYLRYFPSFISMSCQPVLQFDGLILDVDERAAGRPAGTRTPASRR